MQSAGNERQGRGFRPGDYMFEERDGKEESVLLVKGCDAAP